MTFERPWLLVAAPLLAVALAILAAFARRRRIAAANAWSRDLGVRARAYGATTPAIFATLGALFGVALAGPRWGLVARNAEARAMNIVVVMDVSRSMLAQDVTPNRLGRAVSLARRLVEDLAGDRFSLVAFAGAPYVLSPLTLDQSAIELQLDALDPDMMSQGGSGLAPALDLARHVLTSATQGGDRAIVVFTDGETFDGRDPLVAAGRALAHAGITLVAIPVGTIQGARIPEPGGDWHRDDRGNVVVTTRHDELLDAAVSAAGGVFIPASAPDPVGDARGALSHLKRAIVHDRAAADLVPRAWILALIAALVLIAHAWTRRTAALATALLAIGVARATAQRPSRGLRDLRHGDTTGAITAFRAEARTAPGDSNLFNAGTAALVGGDFAAAESDLEKASASVDPGLRQRALYNLGTAFLLQSARDTMQRSKLLPQATVALQQSLLLSPEDRDAKFNYELARRLTPPPSASSSNAKGKNNPRPQSSGNPPPRSRSGMTPAEADQVLNAMERAERATRQSQYQRGRPGEPPRGPDW